MTQRQSMDPQQFRKYQAEVVGESDGMHRRTANLLGTSEIGIKRFAGGDRPIPEYIAQSLRAMVILTRRRAIKELAEMP